MHIMWLFSGKKASLERIFTTIGGKYHRGS